MPVNILVSNDDGYDAPGLLALASELKSLGSVTVVAPEHNRSGASHSLTLQQPVELKQHDDNVYSVSGTPVDCIQVARSGLLQQEPDVIISGINNGPNMGDDTLYSGTVAAAMEGRFLKLSPIAVSMASFQPRHYDCAAKVVGQLLEQQLRTLPSEKLILNVNVPDLAFEDLNGVSVTRLGSRHPAPGCEYESGPEGEQLYWLGPAGKIDAAGDGTDFHAVANGYASVTPLLSDLTHVRHQAVLTDWLQS